MDSEEQRRETQTTERGKQEVSYSQVLNTLNSMEVSESKTFLPSLEEHFIQQIDGLHLTSRRPCWRYNRKEYVISSIVGSSRRGWLTLSFAFREIDCKPRITSFEGGWIRKFYGH